MSVCVTAVLPAVLSAVVPTEVPAVCWYLWCEDERLNARGGVIVLVKLQVLLRRRMPGGASECQWRRRERRSVIVLAL